MHIQEKLAMQGHKEATRKAKRMKLINNFRITFDHQINAVSISLLKVDKDEGSTLIAQWVLSNKFEWVEQEGGSFDAS